VPRPHRPDAPKHKGITFLLVDMKSPGVTVRPLTQINGDADFNEVFFEDVRVPKQNVVGALNKGWDIAITCLMHERQTLTFSRQLQSKVALDEMLDGARRRTKDGKPATADPLVRQALSQAYIESEAMRFLAYRNLTKVLRGGVPGPEGSIEKLFWSEMYQRQLDTRARSSARTRSSCATRRTPSTTAAGRTSSSTRRAARSPPAPPRCSGTSSPSACSACRGDEPRPCRTTRSIGSTAPTCPRLRLAGGRRARRRAAHRPRPRHLRVGFRRSGATSTACPGSGTSRSGTGASRSRARSAAQARELAYAPTLLGFSTEPAVRLAARIADLLPAGLDHVVFTSGGSESNESVIRYVRAYNRLRGCPTRSASWR
jgi:hypothetical protein